MLRLLVPPNPVTKKFFALLSGSDRLVARRMSPIRQPSATGSPPAAMNLLVALSAAMLVSAEGPNAINAADLVPRQDASMKSNQVAGESSPVIEPVTLRLP